MTWIDKPSISLMRLANGHEVAVVKWAACWGWHIDPTPDAPICEGKPFLAKGRAATRELAKQAASGALCTR